MAVLLLCLHSCARQETVSDSHRLTSDCMQEMRHIQERYEKMKVTLSLTSTVSATQRDVVKLMQNCAQEYERQQDSKNVSCSSISIPPCSTFMPLPHFLCVTESPRQFRTFFILYVGTYCFPILLALHFVLIKCLSSISNKLMLHHLS